MTGYMGLILAYLLDLAIGDPVWLPHPVRIIGLAIQKTERFLRSLLEKGPKSTQRLQERMAGILLVIIITGSTCLVMFLIGKGLLLLTGSEHLILKITGAVLMVYLISTILATKGLIDSVQEIITSAKNGDIVAARKNLSRIVGRDTGSLDDKDILRASIESLAENASDGIIAPLFYFVIGGLPLAMTYKAINTLDSMVGYKNEEYINFGWAAARLDDVANYIPARITGLLIVVSIFIIVLFQNTRDSLLATHRSFIVMSRDGRKHLSPNSGFPEAAIAGALNIVLGGASTYNGKLVEKPLIGNGGCSDYLSASEKAINIIRMTSLTAFCIAAAILFLRSSL